MLYNIQIYIYIYYYICNTYHLAQYYIYGVYIYKFVISKDSWSKYHLISSQFKDHSRPFGEDSFTKPPVAVSFAKVALITHKSRQEPTKCSTNINRKTSGNRCSSKLCVQQLGITIFVRTPNATDWAWQIVLGRKKYHTRQFNVHRLANFDLIFWLTGSPLSLSVRNWSSSESSLIPQIAQATAKASIPFPNPESIGCAPQRSTGKSAERRRNLGCDNKTLEAQ